MTPKDFINHSGGAKGSDMAWDKIGRAHGFENHIHWRPEHLNSMTPEGREDMLRSVQAAAEALKRPTNFRGVELVQRNWFQVHHTMGIYAIAPIIAPEGVDFKGFKNKTDKAIVAGGTGWAVEMAIQKERAVYVFDENRMGWNTWSYLTEEFIPLMVDAPLLTKTYAGIGSRNLTPAGMEAIELTYKRTLHVLCNPGEPIQRVRVQSSNGASK